MPNDPGRKGPPIDATHSKRVWPTPNRLTVTRLSQRAAARAGKILCYLCLTLSVLYAGVNTNTTCMTRAWLFRTDKVSSNTNSNVTSASQREGTSIFVRNVGPMPVLHDAAMSRPDRSNGLAWRSDASCLTEFRGPRSASGNVKFLSDDGILSVTKSRLFGLQFMFPSLAL